MRQGATLPEPQATVPAPQDAAAKAAHEDSCADDPEQRDWMQQLTLA